MKKQTMISSYVGKLAFGSDGKVHVSNYSISTSGGQVVRVNY